MKPDNRRRKLIWRLVLVAGLILEIVMIVVGGVSIAQEGFEFSFWQTIAFVAIAIWIYIAYLKQRHMDISRFVVDEKVKTHALIENLKEGVMVVDGENRLMVINSKAAALTGLSEVDGLGKDFTLQADDTVKKVFTSGQEGEVEGALLPGGRLVRFHVVNLPSSGDDEAYRLIYTSAPAESPVVSHSGKGTNTLRTAETILRMKDELLVEIESETSMQKRAAPLGRLIVRAMAEYVQLVAEPVKAMIRQKTLVSNLKKESVPVNRLWRGVPADLFTVAKLNDLDIQLPSDAGEALNVVGDAGLLALAMEQIMYNAVLESIPGGKVVVRAGNMGSHVGVAVMDTGASIGDDVAGCLYEDCYTGVSAKASAGGRVRVAGTGYYLARGIVEAHGGTMTVEGQVEGGVRVMVMLPGA